MKDLNNLSDWSDIKTPQKLGEILLQAGKLNLIHLGMALDIQRFEDMQLGKVLIYMKVITQDELDKALKIQKYLNQKFDKGV
jgi:hypothetical protein